MGDDPSLPSSLEAQLQRLTDQLRVLEDMLAKQTQRIYALEIKAGVTSQSRVEPGKSQWAPVPTPVNLAKGMPPRPSSSGPSPAPPAIAPSVSPPLFSTFSPAAPAAPGSATKPVSLEAQIGGNWLLWVGIVAIVLGTAYFLKLAFENNWIGPAGRVAIGILSGLGFVFWGDQLHKHEYPYYGQMVTGGGCAILYLSAYASFNYYHLVPSAAAFGFMIIVTATGSVLAARYGSLALAFVGLVGGFLTPYWLSTGEDHQVILLTYVSILVAGIAYLARRQRWMILNYTSFVLTVLTFLGWAVSFYNRDKRGWTEFFLTLLAVLFLYVGREALKRTSETHRLAVHVWIALTAALFFAGSGVNLFKSGIELFSFMLVFDAAVLLVALRIKLTECGLAAFILNALFFFVWMGTEYKPDQLVTTLAFLAALFLVFLLWPLLFLYYKKLPTRLSDATLTTLNGLGGFGAAYYLLNTDHHGAVGPLAVVLGAVYLAVGNTVWRRVKEEKRFILITLGVAITLVTLAIPIQLHQHWITLSWAIEAALLTWIGIRLESFRMIQTSWVVMGLAIVRVLAWDSDIPVRTFHFMLNRRVFSFVAVILICYFIAWLLKRSPEEILRRTKDSSRVFILAGCLLTVVLMTMEASGFYALRRLTLFDRPQSEGRPYDEFYGQFRSIENAKQVAFSLIWGIYSVALVVLGILKRYRDIRLFAIALFALTIAKVFFVDLATMERVYRVLSMIALGAILLVAAFLYQRYRKIIL